MFKSRRYLSYANVTATVALVFAMSGGALAASHYLITTTKQIKPSVLSQLKGKAGHTGPAGANGANGVAGPQGAAGAQGPGGAAGAAGAAGASVSSKEVKAGEAACEKLGGTEFTSASGTATACNGKPGTTGFTETLPAGKTETGAWTIGHGEAQKEAAGGIELSISFSIPLASALSARASAHWITPENKEINVEDEEVENTGACKGGTAEKPKAERGNLCIYAAVLTNAKSASLTIQDPVLGGEGTAGSTGAVFNVAPVDTKNPTNGYSAIGTFAVTAP